MSPVVLGSMSMAQEQSWLALLELSYAMPAGWCLVGGQMVHLYCAERAFTPARATNDGDAVLDIRARPAILREFTATLRDRGFTSAGVSMEGHQHRWVRDDAKLDILIPRGVGQRARSRRGVTGGTTLETPGGQQAINRSERVDVQVGGVVARVSRPNMVGALVIKSAAYAVRNDPARERHLFDLATLAAMTRASDWRDETLSRTDRRHLAPALDALRDRPDILAGIDGAERGLRAIGIAMAE